MKFLVAIVALACATGALAKFDMDGSFKMADADGNGWISLAEFEGLFATFDDNGDQIINGTEFVKHFVSTNMSVEGSLYVFYTFNEDNDIGINKTELHNFFAVFDVDKDDSISHIEYASVMNTFLAYLAIAAPRDVKVQAIYDGADSDDNGQLTGAEFWATISPADTDGSGLVSEDEFVTYWRAKTMDTDDRARRLFKILDFDGSGFGSDTEKQAFFTGFDYDNNGLVSKQEFLYSMLNLFSQVMRGLAIDTVKEFENTNLNPSLLFDQLDTDRDSKITEAEMMASVNKSDADHDGRVNLTEYLSASMAKGFAVRSSLFSMFFNDLNDDSVLDMSEYRTSFHHKDQNKDDSISKDEFYRALGISDYLVYFAAQASPKLAAMAYSVDANGDSELSMDELKALTSAADPDGDGNINKDEFVDFWSHHTGLSVAFSEHMFLVFDPNGDGVSSQAERAGLFGAFDVDQNGALSIGNEYGGAMLWQYAKIVRKMQKQVWMKFRGTYNITESFQRGDFNKDGVLDNAESQAFFKLLDKNNDSKLDLFEFVGGYNQVGLALHGGLYLMFTIDSDENQQISSAEFATAFDSLDADDSKTVSMDEYKAVWKKLLYQMSEASMNEYRFRTMFNSADKDKNGNLTATEVGAFFGQADSDKDGLVSAAEFKSFWMKEVGEPADRTAAMFGQIDGDDDGMYGNDQERQQLFDGFDNDDDNLISWDDFSHSLLSMFARSVEIVEAQRNANAVVGFFF